MQKLAPKASVDEKSDLPVGLKTVPFIRIVPEKHGLSRKPAFVGMSKGGVNEHDWATANPDKVSCIYADNPAIRPEASIKLWELARSDVALLNICGSLDFLLQRHTLPIEARYHQLGGRITEFIPYRQPLAQQ